MSAVSAGRTSIQSNCKMTEVMSGMLWVVTRMSLGQQFTYDRDIVPERRRFGHVHVVSGSKCSHVWAGRGEKGDVGDQARGLKMGHLILSMGLERAEVRFFVQRAAIPSKRVFLYLQITTCALNSMNVLAVPCN